VRALIFATLAWVGSACLARAPLAHAEPVTDDRRGAVEPTLNTDAHTLLLEQVARAEAVLDRNPTYEATIVKEERIKGKLLAPQRIACKLREEPFSVYIRFLEPAELEGQQALYAGRRYEGKLIARSAGFAGRLGAVAIDPDGRLAMGGNRYPITEMGMRRLLLRVSEFVGNGEGLEQLVVLHGGQIDARPCTLYEATPRSHSEFALARIYFDDEWCVPVCYEAFEATPEGLQLLERYTYLSVRLGAVLGDDAFDRNNPNYNLR
jgi:hypothetical protein